MGFYRRYVFPRLCDLILRQPRVSALRQSLLANVFGRVLEVGFGTGLNLLHYPAGLQYLTTIDPSNDMHALARHRLKRSHIKVNHFSLSGESMPFPDQSFDHVVSTFTLCSIPNVVQALQEIHRVMKTGGRFWLLEHGLSPDASVQKWQHRLNRWHAAWAQGCQLDRPMRALVQALPFQEVQIKEFYLPPGPRYLTYLYQGMAVK